MFLLAELVRFLQTCNSFAGLHMKQGYIYRFMSIVFMFHYRFSQLWSADGKYWEACFFPMSIENALCAKSTDVDEDVWKDMLLRRAVRDLAKFFFI